METCGLVTLLASTVSIRNVCQCMLCTQGEENSRLTEEGHIISDDAGNLQLRLILRYTDETCLHATAKKRLLGNSRWRYEWARMEAIVVRTVPRF
jgi:hypothetical protein